MAYKLIGNWSFQSSDKYDEYMAAIGVDFARRKMETLAEPKLTITQDGDIFTVRSDSTVKSWENKFKIGDEIDEITFDGRRAKTIYTWDGDKLVQTQKWDGKVTTITRYTTGVDDLLEECVMGDIVCKKYFRRDA